MKKSGWRALAAVLLSVGSLGLGGCLEANPGQIYHAISVDGERYLESCQALAGLGQFTEVRSEIQRDMGELRRLLKASDLQSVKDRVSFLTDRIQTDSRALAQLVESRFSEPTLSSSLRWRTRPEQMGLAPEGQVSIWNVIDARVVGAYNWRGPAQELVDAARVFVRRNVIEVNLARPNVSALEVCQLQDTIALDLLVTFQGYFGATSQMHAVLLAAPGGR